MLVQFPLRRSPASQCSLMGPNFICYEEPRCDRIGIWPESAWSLITLEDPCLVAGMAIFVDSNGDPAPIENGGIDMASKVP